MDPQAASVLLDLLKTGYLNVFGAFIVGSLGSLAYITAIYFGFIALDNRDRKLRPYRDTKEKTLEFKKVFGYCFIGGFTSAVFQINTPSFVAVQSLIIGVTWPAIVSQFLSGKMNADDPRDYGDPNDPKVEQAIERAKKSLAEEIKNLKRTS